MIYCTILFLFYFPIYVQIIQLFTHFNFLIGSWGKETNCRNRKKRERDRSRRINVNNWIREKKNYRVRSWREEKNRRGNINKIEGKGSWGEKTHRWVRKIKERKRINGSKRKKNHWRRETKLIIERSITWKRNRNNARLKRRRELTISK